MALSATSLGLVIPVLKDAGQVDGPIGQYTIAGATVADFAAVVLLSLLFSHSKGGPGAKLFMFGTFVVVVLVVAVTLGRAMRFDALITRLQDTTAEIRGACDTERTHSGSLERQGVGFGVQDLNSDCQNSTFRA